MSKHLKIAVLPGDGIGPEITAQAVRVLKRLSDQGHFQLSLEEAPVGGAGYRASGHPLPQPTLKLAKDSDAILFGSVGDFSLDALPRELRPEQAILGLRKELQLFANLRPATIYPELAGASTLKPEVVSGMDIMIIRELTGDIYFGQPRGWLFPIMRNRIRTWLTPPRTTWEVPDLAHSSPLRSIAELEVYP